MTYNICQTKIIFYAESERSFYYGKVKVYIETPDEKYCFKHATCWLPAYEWEDIFQYSDEEIDRFDEIIHSMAHLIMEFSQEGGFNNASNF